MPGFLGPASALPREGEEIVKRVLLLYLSDDIGEILSRDVVVASQGLAFLYVVDPIYIDIAELKCPVIGTLHMDDGVAASGRFQRLCESTHSEMWNGRRFKAANKAASFRWSISPWMYA